MYCHKKILNLALSGGLVLSLFAPPSCFARNDEVCNKIRESRKQQHDILKKIEGKENEADIRLKSIRASEKHIDAIIKDMEPIQAEYLKARKELERVKSIFRKRLREIYMKGGTNLLSKLLNANSLQDFLGRFEIARILIHNDHELLRTYKAAAEAAKNSRKKYDDKIEIIQAEIEQLKQEREKIYADIGIQKREINEMRHFEMSHLDQLIEINVEELKSGRLNFPFTGPFVKPMSRCEMSSGYGWRCSPRSEFHSGVDYRAPIGTPVFAVSEGVVVESKPARGYGWLITIYHGNKNGRRVYTRYAHSYPKQVKVVLGQQVYAGDQITSVGANGDVTGPHLHFEVRAGSGNNPGHENPIGWFK